MTLDIALGQVGRLNRVVDASMVITLGGDSRATVFSTPKKIFLMERSAREALRPYIEPGEESVGIDVSIRHVGRAGIGATVQGVATVSAIKRIWGHSSYYPNVRSCAPWIRYT